MVICVFPSEVAALCGRDPFRNKEEAFQTLMERQKGTKTRKRTFTEIQKDGIRAEQNLVAQGLLKENNTIVKKTLRLTNGIVLLLYGKVDGINAVGEPIEVKHRTIQCTINEMFEHEKIQLYIYMFILGKQYGTFMETNGHSTDIYTQIIEWDQEAWRSITEELQSMFSTYFTL